MKVICMLWWPKLKGWIVGLYISDCLSNIDWMRSFVTYWRLRANIGDNFLCSIDDRMAALLRLHHKIELSWFILHSFCCSCFSLFIFDNSTKQSNRRLQRYSVGHMKYNITLKLFSVLFLVPFTSSFFYHFFFVVGKLGQSN